MSSGEIGSAPCHDIQQVRNLIEQCLHVYMTQREIVDTLYHQAKIEPRFTELVWKKLEEENQQFFKAYHLRLMLKEQILRFNCLLERHVELAHHMCPAEVASVPFPNKFQIPLMHHSSVFNNLEQTGEDLKPENMHKPIGVNLCNTFTNGGSALHHSMQTTIGLPCDTRVVNGLSNTLLAQSSNVEMVRRMNGRIIKSESDYADNSQLMFGVDGNVLDANPATGNASVSSFSSLDSNSHPLNETILDAHASSFGYLGQIPRNFSLSDLTADFSSGSDILDSYSRSPFLGTDAENFLDPLGSGENQDPTASQ